MNLTSLIAEIRNRSDMNNSEFITDTELTGFINLSLKELHALLVNNYGVDMFVDDVSMAIAANATETTADLPDDCLKIMGVDLEVTGSQYITLRQFNFANRNEAANMNETGQATQYWTNYRYRPRGKKISISPKASGALTLRVWYVPEVVELVLGVDTIDINDSLYGWLEYVIVDCCIKCLQKEESDTAVFQQQKQALIQRVRNEVQNRTQDFPQTVTDTYALGATTGPLFGGWGRGY